MITYEYVQIKQKQLNILVNALTNALTNEYHSWAVDSLYKIGPQSNMLYVTLVYSDP